MLTSKHGFAHPKGDICVFRIHQLKSSAVEIYTEITEINLSTFVYRVFCEDFSSLAGTNLLNHFPVLYTFCRLLISVHKTLHRAFYHL